MAPSAGPPAAPIAGRAPAPGMQRGETLAPAAIDDQREVTPPRAPGL